MQPTTDAALVAAKLSAAFGREMNTGNVGKEGTYAFVTEAGALVFTRKAPGEYFVTLGAVPGARGKRAKEMINEAFAWLFVNTDALVIRGHVSKANLQLLALIPHTPGAKPAVDDGPRYLCSATIGLWAKGYGIDKALSELRAAGQNEKADKLAKAVGVRRG